MSKRKNDRKEFIHYLVELASSSIDKDVYKGLSFYLCFMALDFYIFPKSYQLVWSIRLTLVAICLFFVMLHKRSMLLKYRRPVFLFSLSLILNSVSVIWLIRRIDSGNVDITLPALALAFTMSSFRLLTLDAMIVGGIYFANFIVLISFDDMSSQQAVRCLVILGIAYAIGAIGANVAESYLYKTFSAEKQLRKETERADDLLEKTFPSEVANELKQDHSVKAMRFDNVTVMFCDIVNFTEASAKMPPEELVRWLNEVFSTFDRLTYQFGCEKIKTIGDAYMAVCGVPTPSENHASKIINLALALNAAAEKLSLNGTSLKIRIGVNSGSVVAGVIGERRFAYDLWGDTVNTASRMEALATPGKILITESTKNYLDESFVLLKVPDLTVKGKGKMDGWQVVEASTTNGPLNKGAVA